MTQEEKQILLQDLCGRLPYGVLIEHPDLFNPQNKVTEKFTSIDGEFINDDGMHIEQVKPYLRSMSSMTEEEKKEYNYMVFDYEYDNYWYPGKYTDAICVDGVDELVDWLNAHHFDYRGLIERGLALEAPKDMYK